MKGRQRIAMVLISLMSVPQLAQAGGIEKLVMPGPLASVHAEYEDDCNACHQRFNRKRQKQLCLVCHEDIANDLNTATGYHGREKSVASGECSNCHAEHGGRNTSIVDFDQRSFDHGLADFELRGVHVDQACGLCHIDDKKFREAPSTCIACHREDDAHEGNLGETCADCHTESGWQPASFDHDTTDFPLIGVHMETTCLDCHADTTFEDTKTECVACHLSDDAHQGRFGRHCDSCHTPRDWQATLFDHDRDTRFLLTGSHSSLSCGDCHSADPHLDRLESTCHSCHADDDEHRSHNGNQCERCHVADTWPRVTFSHADDTGFALRGGHAAVACTDCHVDPVFESALSTDCYACHQDEDAHQGQQGRECGRCHNESAWTGQVAFDHDLTNFPLLGAHAEPPCADCHQTHAFRDAPTNCVDCHRDDDVHAERLGPDCALCHNPVGWHHWSFDHNTQTQFELDGAHTDASCHSCHIGRLDRFVGAGWECVSCHRVDDAHDGEFDDNCSRCHTTRSFSELHDFR